MGPIMSDIDRSGIVFARDDRTAATLPNSVAITITSDITRFETKDMKDLSEVIQRRPMNRAERRAAKRGK